MKFAASTAVCAIALLALGGCSTGIAPANKSRAVSVAAPFTQEMRLTGEGVFGGEQVSYEAALETYDISGKEGRPDVELVSVSYVAEPKADAAPRPVLFVFNGGPISASLYLHMGAVGPKRVHVPEDLSAPVEAYALVDNPYSPLDVADIVLFDPASTGFSRVVEGGDPEAYYSVEADAQQFTDFVAAWLSRHNRQDAPVYILGESYGTMRATEAAGQLAEAEDANAPAGVFLMGQAVNIIEYAQRRQNIISYVVSLPTLVAMGVEQGKVDTHGKSVEEYMAEASEFAETEYLVALFQGNRLSDDALQSVASKLESYTGLSAEYFVEKGLKVKKDEYRLALLADEGKVLGVADGRYINDDTKQDASGVISDGYYNGFRQYMAETFGLDIEGTYKPSAEVAGLGAWDWGGSSPFSAYDYSVGIDKAFEANPDLRVLIGNGYHDTMTTVGAAEYLAAQANWPASQVRLSFYPGGHMAYSLDSSAERFGQDIRDWITGQGNWAKVE